MIQGLVCSLAKKQIGPILQLPGPAQGYSKADYPQQKCLELYHVNITATF